MRLERGVILRTRHQIGLRWTKSSPLHAGVCPQSPHPLPTPSPGEATGSTLPPRQTKLWGEKAILTRGRRLTSAQQGREKNHPRGVWRIPVPRKGGRWGATPGPQLSRVPTGKPNGENNGSLQPIFRLHGNTGRVRMSDCVRGIEPCECKGKGHRFQRVGLLGCFSLVKMRRERKE